MIFVNRYPEEVSFTKAMNTIMTSIIELHFLTLYENQVKTIPTIEVGLKVTFKK